MVAAGAIGKVISCLTHEAIGWFHGSTYMRRWNRFRKMSGDMLLHKGCHTFDVINFITGAHPVRVAAFGGHGGLPASPRGRRPLPRLSGRR